MVLLNRLFFLSALIYGDLYSMSKTKDSYSEVMDVINVYSDRVKKERNIRLSSYGISYVGRNKPYDGKIYTISLGYQIDANMEYDEARSYFYGLVDGFLLSINQEERLGEYFHHFPIGYEDLWFCLSLDYSSKGFLKKGEIDAIHIMDNEIYYSIVEVEGKLLQPHRTEIAPGAYRQKGLIGNCRCIRKSLPEE